MQFWLMYDNKMGQWVDVCVNIADIMWQKYFLFNRYYVEI